MLKSVSSQNGVRFAETLMVFRHFIKNTSLIYPIHKFHLKKISLKDTNFLVLFLRRLEQSIKYKCYLFREFMVSIFSYSKILEVSSTLIFEFLGIGFPILVEFRLYSFNFYLSWGTFPSGKLADISVNIS